MSLSDFFKYCKECYPTTCDTDKIHADMKNIVYHTMNSVRHKINSKDRNKFNVWLIEINTNPCLDESSPHL